MLRTRSMLLLICAALVACQPVDSSGLASARPDQASAPLGAPDQGVPVTLGALLEAGGRAAAQWQDRAVPVEITVELATDRWQSAHVMYLAPESDRFMRYVVGPQGAEQSRPTLTTLSLKPVTAPALRAVPSPPRGMLDPAPLLDAASAALSRCRVDLRVAEVTYATGAPFAWDGVRWTERPSWTATVNDRERFAVVDPVSGRAAGPCGTLTDR
jgi:hypothetical protein